MPSTFQPLSVQPRNQIPPSLQPDENLRHDHFILRSNHVNPLSSKQRSPFYNGINPPSRRSFPSSHLLTPYTTLSLHRTVLPKMQLLSLLALGLSTTPCLAAVAAPAEAARLPASEVIRNLELLTRSTRDLIPAARDLSTRAAVQFRGMLPSLFPFPLALTNLPQRQRTRPLRNRSRRPRRPRLHRHLGPQLHHRRGPPRPRANVHRP